MFRKGFAGRAPALEGGNGGAPRRRTFRRDLVLGRIGLKFLKLQFHLLDQPGAAFRALAVLLTAQLGDLELQVFDHRFGGRNHRTHLRQFGFNRRGTRL